MMRKFAMIMVLLLSLFTACSPIYKMYVPFGTAKKEHEKRGRSNVSYVYFDRLGFIYPDYNIDDREMRDAGGDFTDYYTRHRAAYLSICKEYNAAPMNDPAPTDDNVQAPVINRIADRINKKVDAKTKLVVVIHGYNESPYKPSGQTSSDEYDILIDRIEKKYPKQKFEFLEVFWDGCAAVNGPGFLYPFNSFAIFDNAQFHSCNAGLELRRIFSKLNNTQTYVITHSLGASVITSALFNLRKFPERTYDDPDDPVHVFAVHYNDPLYNTPTSNFTVGMLAPAIPGTNTFKTYYQRTAMGKDTKVEETNYKFIIGFNTYDPVLRKFISVPSKFGSTTLGCRRKEIRNTYCHLDNSGVILDTVNFSLFYNSATGKKVPQRKHSFSKYLDNSQLDEFLAKVFGS